ncbi:D-mannonate oxidoreductase [Aggregatibacter actinomycetemcomitans serotype e str. SC1083]|uniref:D-mannonate oxidoreductase n=2 Tax=Aggregatibacter actinomycetemcomitans TaxID=714 RepID=G4A8E2_AGGAC|nr:FCD domain-containing protein [Aggregatibacter actinomycetemcomitans]EGY33962.1 D-mannonate oxidoreductase [Aggregatibacter actinomycetemcomitans serotype e str. SC1083]KYK75278.1 GntR family transcriptional regulator [Aggregatibacter actinomycetemcomitans serotype e str. SA3096]KYK82766.1 GntR family transcriptional regulator [Aggregatibacter actinomycetemcomitans serotype e str. SC936]TYB21706.1 FCD domain-containing protein [Aggregatibacter actinomycetemcomitans]
MNLDDLRSYKKIGNELKEQLANHQYKVGDKLPAERDLAEYFNVSRTVIREALIMLEIENLVEVRKGSGVYVIALPQRSASNDDLLDKVDVGPFELLQARQLLESSIAEFAALQATRADITKLKDILATERATLEQGDEDYVADEDFHRTIAEITQNEVIVQMQKALWDLRVNSQMWKGLHLHIPNQSHRHLWLQDHENIITALQRKDPAMAKKAMWQHLENVKQKLFELSDVDDPNFDGYLFNMSPIVVER